MRHLLATLLMAASGYVATAQTLNVVSGHVTYAYPAEGLGEMVFSQSTTLTVGTKVFPLAAIDSIYVDNTTVEDNVVRVTYSQDEAYVLVAGNVAAYVTPQVVGAQVSLVQSSLVSESTCGEITYCLSGASSAGSLTLSGDYKATFELSGLSLTSQTGAPLTIDNGKRIKLSVKNGTVNTLTDAAGGSQKGCIDCKGHLELQGKGTLDVTGNTAHAIYAKEYVEMKNCTVNVLAAVKDGLNCNQYFSMESGTLNIDGVNDDGIQVSYKDDTNRESEDTGSITIAGGTIVIAVTAPAAKGMKAEGNVLITDGRIDITATGDGEWDAEESKTSASSCISADGSVTITGGTLNLTATGAGGKGISADGEVVVTGGDLNVQTSGNLLAYVNKTLYTNYTGNADKLASNYKSAAKGIKCDGNINISGGDIAVTTTGTGAEGIESKARLTISGGTLEVSAYDDGINAANDLVVEGGDLTVLSTKNDGLDANGNLYLSGGVVRAFGASSPECGIDANSEAGYKVYITGGSILAVGGSNSTPTTSASTQAYVSGSGSVTANTQVSLSSGTEVLATFTVPAGYGTSGTVVAAGGPGFPGGSRPGSSSGGSVLVSCAGLQSGNSYTLVVGSTTSTVTAKLTGSSGGGFGR